MPPDAPDTPLEALEDMLSRTTLLLTAIGIAASAPGCAWVTLMPEAEEVRVVRSADEVSGCEKVGLVTAQTRARVGFIARSSEKVAEELATLARNNAADMDADTLLAEGPPSVDGRQRFAAYRCR
jgi:hypothetical protein